MGVYPDEDPVPTVLYYDPEPVHREQARSLYEGAPDGIRLLVPGTFEETVRYLSREAVDAVVTDPPDEQAVVLLSLTRELAGDVPFVLFMAPGRERTALTAFNSGATWYFERPPEDHHPRALCSVVDHALSLRSTDTAVVPRDQYLEFLSETALDLATMDDEDGLYAYVAERVLELVPRSLVGVTSFDPATRIFTVRAFVGPPGTLEVFVDVFGQTPVGWRLPIDVFPSSETALRSRAMIEAPPALYLLCYRTLPEELCRRVDDRLGPGRAFSLGFQCRRGCIGTVAIRLLPGGELANRELVEALVHQVSVALQRNRSGKARPRETGSVPWVHRDPERADPPV